MVFPIQIHPMPCHAMPRIRLAIAHAAGQPRPAPFVVREAAFRQRHRWECRWSRDGSERTAEMGDDG